MNPIKTNQPSVERTSGGYTANAMRAIRALQEQMKELGKRLQDEITNPTGSGPEQQQLIRDLAQQINSVKMELEALQESIIQHQTLAALKKGQANQRQAVPATGQVRSPQDEPQQSQGNSSPRVDKISALGSVIDTTA